MSLMLAPSTLFTARDDEDGASSDGDDRDVPDLAHGEGEPGKAKRQVLSCTTCRKRKVKCDRVQPCQACCARGQPRECTFAVAEKDDYEPIKQSYEIRELRKENLRLKERLRAARHAPAALDASDDGATGERKHPPRVPSKPTRLQQRRFQTADASDNLYFGSPGLANVIADFANAQISTRPAASMAHTIPRGVDVFAYQDAPLYAFPTLWRADGGAAVLLTCLPPKDELLAYLDSFQLRVQSCAFPHVPEEITKKEIERFLAHPEDNAFRHPDMLALIFAALAQGLQMGVYDKSGGRWIEGAMEAETWKGDLYIAAAMQALRVASFMNRPTLLVIETLIMIGPYLTNGGKFLDAWALFGVTIRLAQSIGLHRNPKYLDPTPPLRESGIRQSLWWWMLHMDQQYSMTLGRPLGISGIGDCPPPEPLTTNATILRLSEYMNAFTILARQILSSDKLTVQKIDHFTDRLLALRDTLPEIVQFDETWLDPNRRIPEWPLDAQAAVFYGKTHTFLVLLNRQRLDNEPATGLDREPTSTSQRTYGYDDGGNKEDVPLRGRERVLASARALLNAFEFFHTRVRAAMICWTMGQQAFNASMILTLSLLHPVASTTPAAAEAARNDYYLVHRTYATFVEMHHKGIHRLAGVACSKLSALLMQLHPAPSSSGPFGLPPVSSRSAVPEAEGAGDSGDAVMGHTGMLLLEDPGLQGFMDDGGFAPLGFQMAGGALPPQGMGIGSPGWAARPAASAPTTTTTAASAAAVGMSMGMGMGMSGLGMPMMGLPPSSTPSSLSLTTMDNHLSTLMTTSSPSTTSATTTAPPTMLPPLDPMMSMMMDTMAGQYHRDWTFVVPQSGGAGASGGAGGGWGGSGNPGGRPSGNNTHHHGGPGAGPGAVAGAGAGAGAGGTGGTGEEYATTTTTGQKPEMLLHAR